jgi:GAF domain-containing protein
MMLTPTDFAAEFLQRTASQLIAARTPEALLEAASVYARGRGATAGTLVYADLDADQEQPRWRVVAEWALKGIPLRGIGQVSLEHADSASAWFLAHPNEPYFIEHAPDHPDLHPAVRQQCRDLQRRSMVLIPLKNQDRWVGLLGFFWRDAYVFDAADQRVFGSVIYQIAPVVDSLRLLESSKQQAARLESLNRISTALTQAADEVSIVAALARLVQQHGGSTIELEYQDVAEVRYLATSTAAEDDQCFLPATVARWQEGEGAFGSNGYHQLPPHSSADYGIDALAGTSPESPLFIENLLDDPRLSAEDRARLGSELPSRGLVYMQLVSGGRLQGNLAVAWNQAHPFSDDERAIYTRLCQTLADVVASRRAYLAEQEARRESETLYRAGEGINRARTFEELLEVLVSFKMAGDGIGISIFDTPSVEGASRMLVYTRAMHTPDYLNLDIPLDEFPAVRRMLDEGRFVLITDPEHDPRLDPVSVDFYRKYNIQSVLGVALLVGGQFIGVLTLTAVLTRQEFTQSDIRQINGIANLVATAVERIRLQEQTLKASLQAEKLAQVSAGLAQATDEVSVLQALVPLAQLCGAAQMGLEYMDVAEARQTSTQPGDYVPAPVAVWLNGEVQQVAWGQSPLRSASDYGIDKVAFQNPQEPLFIENLLEDPRLTSEARERLGQEVKSRALVYMALFSGGRLQGNISIAWREPRTFAAEEKAIFSGLRQTLSDVVASRRSYLAEQQARQEAETLYRAGEAINQATTFESLIDRLVELRPPGSGVGITLFDTPTFAGASRIHGIARYVTEHQHIRHENPLADVPSMEFLPQAGVVSVTDPETDPRLDERSRAFYREYGMKSILGVALMVGGEYIGAFTLATRQRYVFSENDKRQLSGLANLVATAVTRIRLQEQTLTGQRRAEKLAQISTALARAADQASLGEAFSSFLQETGAAIFSISYIDPEESTEPAQNSQDVHLRYSSTVYGLWNAEGNPLLQEYKPAGGPMFGSDLDALLQRDLQQIVYVEDMLSDPRLSSDYRAEFVRRFGFYAGVYLPLFHNNRLQGYMAVGWHEPHIFSDEERYLYERLKRTLSAHAAARRAYMAEEDARHESDMLYRAGEQINKATTIHEITDAVASLPLQASLVALGVFEGYNMEAATWQDIYLRELKPGGAITLKRLLREEHPAGFAFRNRDMMIIEDTATDPSVPETSRHVYLEAGVRALLTITLKIGDRIIGGVGFNDYQPRHYTARHKRITTGLGGLVSNGLERIRLRQEAEDARRRAETLSHIHAAVSGSHDEASILGALESFAGAIGASSMSLRYVDSDEDGAILRSWLVAEWKQGRVRPISMGERQPNFPMQEWWGKVVGGLFVSEDVQTDARISPDYRLHLTDEGITSMASLLLYGGGGMQALLSVFWREPHHFSLDEQHIFSQLTRTLPTVVATRRAFLAEQQRARQLETVAKVSAAVTGRLNRDELLQTLTEMTEVSFENFHMEIFLLDEMHYLVQATHGASGLPRLEIELEDEHSLIARAARQRQPARLDDITSLGSGSLAPLIPDARAELAVPMTLGERLIGVLVVQSTEAGRFSETDSWVMSTLADLLSVAIQNADLYAQAQEGAAYEERNRLARELHDSVSQALYGIALGTKTARALLDRDPTRLKEPLDYILQLADAGLMEMRALIFDLRKDSLQEEGLLTALTRQTDSLGARYGIQVENDFCEEPALPLATKEGIYWVAREALHNIVKHAKATRIDLLLDCNETSLWLEIRDNGLGFDTDQDFKGHMGLGNMRERTARLGGALEINSLPGQGTLVRVRVPRPLAEGAG